MYRTDVEKIPKTAKLEFFVVVDSQAVNIPAGLF